MPTTPSQPFNAAQWATGAASADGQAPVPAIDRQDRRLSARPRPLLRRGHVDYLRVQHARRAPARRPAWCRNPPSQVRQWSPTTTWLASLQPTPPPMPAPDGVLRPPTSPRKPSLFCPVVYLLGTPIGNNPRASWHQDANGNWRHQRTQLIVVRVFPFLPGAEPGGMVLPASPPQLPRHVPGRTLRRRWPALSNLR